MLKLPGEVRIRRGASLAMLLALSGCAALRSWQEPEPEPEAETGLAAGLAALEAQDYLEAHDRLTAVYSAYPDDPVGAKALLALAAMELDPRNPGRRLNVGAEIIGRYFMMDTVPRWQWPLLETTYLLALELGAPPYRVEPVGVETAAALEVAAEAPADEVAAERAAESAEAGAEAVRRTLPSLPGPTVVAQLAELRASRNAVRGEAETLRARVAELETQLAEAQAELERIRKTIKP